VADALFRHLGQMDFGLWMVRFSMVAVRPLAVSLSDLLLRSEMPGNAYVVQESAVAYRLWGEF
jgi:hypothetical protein